MGYHNAHAVKLPNQLLSNFFTEVYAVLMKERENK